MGERGRRLKALRKWDSWSLDGGYPAAMMPPTRHTRAVAGAVAGGHAEAFTWECEMRNAKWESASRVAAGGRSAGSDESGGCRCQHRARASSHRTSAAPLQLPSRLRPTTPSSADPPPCPRLQHKATLGELLVALVHHHRRHRAGSAVCVSVPHTRGPHPTLQHLHLPQHCHPSLFALPSCELCIAASMAARKYLTPPSRPPQLSRSTPEIPHI